MRQGTHKTSQKQVAEEPTGCSLWTPYLEEYPANTKLSIDVRYYSY